MEKCALLIIASSNNFRISISELIFDEIIEYEKKYDVFGTGLKPKGGTMIQKEQQESSMPVDGHTENGTKQS